MLNRKAIEAPGAKKKIVDFLEMNRQGTGDKPLPFMNSLVCSPEN